MWEPSLFVTGFSAETASSAWSIKLQRSGLEKASCPQAGSVAIDLVSFPFVEQGEKKQNPQFTTRWGPSTRVSFNTFIQVVTN